MPTRKEKERKETEHRATRDLTWNHDRHILR